MEETREERKALQKAKRRTRKRHPAMKVSGRGLKRFGARKPGGGAAPKRG